jgi:hypothetical protein
MCFASRDTLLIKTFVKEKLSFPDNNDSAENQKQYRMDHLAVRVCAKNFHRKVPR